jgi:hypothetical protein
MSDVLVAADESGNFDFSRNPGATRYLILCTVTAEDFEFGNGLLDLRRRLAFEGKHLKADFHAATDPQEVRDDVFALIAASKIRVDFTLFEKSKAQSHLQSKSSLYKMAWYLHLKYVAPRVVRKDDRLLVVAASMGTAKDRGRFLQAVEDVVQQVSPCRDHQVAFWRDESEPCLWVADYCAWAIQRKYERSDDRSYVLIEHLVKSRFDAWSIGPTHYY